MKVQKLWKLEIIGITDFSQTYSKAAEKYLTHNNFLKEATTNEEGLYNSSLVK